MASPSYPKLIPGTNVEYVSRRQNGLDFLIGPDAWSTMKTLWFKAIYVEPILNESKRSTVRRTRCNIQRGETVAASVGPRRPFAQLLITERHSIHVDEIEGAHGIYAELYPGETELVKLTFQLRKETLMPSTLAMTTVEHLGKDATERDLSEYKAAVERIMESREFDRDEEGAIEYVWHNGSIQFNAATCLYCQRAVFDQTIIPAADDDQLWGDLSLEHDDDCEWISTRAHNRF